MTILRSYFSNYFVYLGSLTQTFDKVKENKSGQMDPCMKAGGKIIKPTEKVDSFMLMVMSMMECGKMIKHTAMVPIAIWMVLNMKVTGKRINNMVKVLRPGQMVPNMMVNMYMERNMDKDDSHGLTVAHISVSLKKTIFKVMEPTIGLMEGNL